MSENTTITFRPSPEFKKILIRISKKITKEDEVQKTNYTLFIKTALKHFSNSEKLIEYLTGLGIEENEALIYAEEIRKAIEN